MNNASFYTKVQVPKPGVGCKNRSWVWMNLFCPSNVVSVGWMKLHLIMITSTPSKEFVINNFVI
jgi:hypothetical protein